MLQQTQATTVVSHYDQFLNRFPSVQALANSTENDVLHAWTGLGYYRRARYMHEAAQQIVDRFNGTIPRSLEDLCSLPGIGRSTAGAILSCAFAVSAPILDANVRRILARFHAVNGPAESRIADSQLWDLAIQHTPSSDSRQYTQAIMDFGTKQCVRSNPNCDICPLRIRCKALLHGEVHLYPSRSSSKPVEVTKRPLIILDASGSCLLQQRGESGMYARLWEMPSLPENSSVETVLAKLELPLERVQIRKGPIIHPYTISNQRVTEDSTLARYSVEASTIGSPRNTRWYENDKQTPLGMSVKTKKRIDLAKGIEE